MDKVLAIIFLLVLFSAFLYFLPFFGDFFGASFESSAVKEGQSPVWLSSDKGATFQKTVWHSVSYKNPAVLDFAVSGADSNIVYAATNQGLFSSRDGGLNWYEWSDLEKKINSQTVIYKVLVNPFNKAEIFISIFKNGSGEVYSSRDNFFILESVFKTFGEGVYDLTMSAAGKLYLGLSDGRILSYNPNTKELQPLAVLNSPIVDIESVNGNLYAATKFKGFFVSSDGGRVFLSSQDGLALQSRGRLKSLAVEPVFGHTVYAASLGGLSKSFNQGASWSVVPTLASKSQEVESVALASDNSLYLGIANQFYRSRDNGVNWQIVLELEQGRRVNVIDFIGGGKIALGIK